MGSTEIGLDLKYTCQIVKSDENLLKIKTNLS